MIETNLILQLIIYSHKDITKFEEEFHKFKLILMQ
jgi:hypothetical protein